MKKPFSKGILTGIAMLALVAAVRTTPVDQFGNPLANQQPGGVTNFTKLKVLDQLMFGTTVPAKLGATKDIYIAARTDSPPCAATNICGSGLKMDPYDGSTRAKFDAVMAAKLATGGTANVEAGTFLTYGSQAWHLPVGARMIGVGIGKTTVKLDPGVTIPNFGVTVINSDYNQDGASLYVADLTVDGNYPNLSNPNTGVVNGVALYGNNSIAERVHFKNGFGDFVTLREHFGIFLAGKLTETTPSHGQKILNCKASDFKGDYGGGLVIIGNTPTNNASEGGLISGSEVDGYNPIDDDPTSGHVGGIGIGGGVVRDCLIKNCHVGIYCETGIDNAFINNNILNCMELAIDLVPVGGDIVRPRITGNTIEMRRDYNDHSWALRFSANGSYHVRNGLVDGNIFRLKATGSLTGSNVRAIVSDAALGLGNSYVNNQIDVGLVAAEVAADSYYSGNKNLTNGPAPGLFEIEKKSTFTPTAGGGGVGWYRLLTGASGAGGLVRVKAIYGAGFSDLEFAFDVTGYGIGVGTIQQLRANQGAVPVITQARLSSDGGSSVYLDLYVAYTTTPAPIQISVYGANMPELVAAPAVGATVGSTDPLTFIFGKGLATSYGLSVGANQVVGARGAAVANATDAASAITQLNALLARCRAHGLIAP